MLKKVAKLLLGNKALEILDNSYAVSSHTVI